MRLFTADLLCALVLSFCDLVYPRITRTMINDLIPNRLLDELLLFAAALLGIYLLKMCLNYFIQKTSFLKLTAEKENPKRLSFIRILRTAIAKNTSWAISVAIAIITTSPLSA